MTGVLAWRNGEFLPARELTISHADAGFVSGATVTDFCRTCHGELVRWDLHQARFRRDCAWLGVALPPGATLTAAATELVRVNAPLSPGRDLALISFATPGPLGYLLGVAENGPPTVAMHTVVIDPARYSWVESGAEVRAVGDWPAGEFWPAHVKHRSRVGWYQAGRHLCLQPGELAALLAPGGVADTAVGSVVYYRASEVLLPPGGLVLAGVSSKILAEDCAAAGVVCREEAVDFRAVAAGAAGVDEVWLTGSAFGVAAVRRASWGAVSWDYPGRGSFPTRIAPPGSPPGPSPPAAGSPPRSP